MAKNGVRQNWKGRETGNYNFIVRVFLLLFLLNLGSFCSGSSLSCDGSSGGKCLRVGEILLDLRMECISERLR
jgi:hypothetical protein